MSDVDLVQGVIVKVECPGPADCGVPSHRHVSFEEPVSLDSRGADQASHLRDPVPLTSADAEASMSLPERGQGDR